MLIQLPNNARGPKGGYGMYFQLSRNRGVKLLRGSFSSVTKAMNSSQMKSAMEERDTLMAAQYSGVTPKCYGVTVVQRGSVFRVGIIMEHLGSVRLADLNLDEETKDDIKQSLHDALGDYGVTHDDMHDWNVMVKNGKYFAIDFTPDYSRVEAA